MTDKKYPRVMRARVTEECLVWFKTEAKNRDMNLSEFIREIPTIINVWESQLDEKDNIIRGLQEEFIKLSEVKTKEFLVDEFK